MKKSLKRPLKQQLQNHLNQLHLDNNQFAELEKLSGEW